MSVVIKIPVHPNDHLVIFRLVDCTIIPPYYTSVKLLHSAYYSKQTNNCRIKYTLLTTSELNTFIPLLNLICI